MMHLSNLAVCFGPTLSRTEEVCIYIYRERERERERKRERENVLFFEQGSYL